MGILKSWFTAKPHAEEPSYEIVEGRLSIDESRFKVRVRKAGREFYAEELFQTAEIPGDLNFGRFFLLDENPPKPHFAPSLQEAVDWFTGRKNPNDGYNTIWWGDRCTYECTSCRAKRVAPLRIMRIERLTVASAIPTHREIVGWRVVEVESELTGKGIPTKKLDNFKTKPVLKWANSLNRYLCGNCARKLVEVGRGTETADAFIFEVE